MLKTASLFALFALASLPAMAGVAVRSCDRDVTFDAPPQRAVSNDVNLTEMMLALKLQDRMVGYTGVSGWKTLDATLREGIGELPELSTKYPSKEVLVGADADFYFAGWNYGMKVGGEVTPETLAPLGIKVYELTESCIHIMKKDKSSFADFFNDIENLGKIFGVSDRADKLIAGYEARLAEIEAGIDPKAEKPRVFVYDSGTGKLFTAGGYAMPTALIEAAGGKNVMDDVSSSWTTVGWEAVVDRDPEVIVIVNYGDVTAEQKRRFMLDNAAFRNMSAVKNDRFVVLEYVEATPGPRNIEAVAKLAAAFHPAAK
ncbi:ABC transporter substrate-binding protein [Pleomorphomonas sp. NRK KF1]|uniref:ABC transporter substrate-binding protein n=1 Tax=Pleomorphomonas sp. NRK KF1 TaxID=2943000 RepID=UPI002042DD47|nr:ABC transporter substrate-binding protein [Pleomorphomonas sp. NRK KF1]MCM5552971.1 ABC transporter substrate-binding protein [Pleomorphomonas sp. NRK KF1]